MPKTLNLIERLNKSSKCLKECFFIMPGVEKRAILVASNLNNLYFCVTPHCRLFFNFSIMKKQQKRKKIIHKIISSNISKSSIKKSKRNSPNFWIGPGQAGW